MNKKLSGSMIAVALALVTGTVTTFATQNSTTTGETTAVMLNTLTEGPATITTATTEVLTTDTTFSATTTETRNTLAQKQTSEDMNQPTQSTTWDAITATDVLTTGKFLNWVDGQQQTG